ncbi:vWA domain-containing protein [Halioxenophilus sp. WMMB6]|uniref:vWA domain-containing protein n=1 Tax=Halioxenophilus sp. WMMB6 TaxID=3073815 RepID=UPI00295EDCB9|nr:vWA domain-containing protein [Halioxenophilus sp. WMMB6]
MKIPNREINIFSMSALDLFASALGAFIFLSVISLPFFPNTGKSEVTIPDLDLVIVLDVSASMEEEISQLKREIADLADVLNRLAPSVGIGVVTYGDRLWAEPISQHPITDTTEMAGLKEYIDAIEPNMGVGGGSNPDVPEMIAAALDQAVAMNWREQSRVRYIVAITDAPAYPEKISVALQSAKDFSAVEEHYISTVMVRNEDAKKFLNALAEAGQGEFVNSIDGQSLLASILLAILQD